MAKKYSKQEIGEGIGALFRKIDSEIQNSETQAQVVKKLANTVAIIPISQIEVNPLQPRKEFEKEGIGELAESIKVYGIIQPLTLRRLAPRQFQLISGERRLRASKIVGLKEVPAYIRLADDREMMEMALVENIQRENLNPLDMANSLVRLKDEFEINDEALATILGKRRSTITNYRSILKLPPNIQEYIRNEEISMGHAKALVGVEDPMLRQDFFTRLIEENLSVRALEDLIRSHKEKSSAEKSKPKSSKLPDDYDRVQNNLRERFGIKKVQLKLKSEGKGQIVIPFNSVDDLNRILDVIEE